METVNEIPPGSDQGKDTDKFQARLAEMRERIANAPPSPAEEDDPDHALFLARRSEYLHDLFRQAGSRLSACRFSNFVVTSPYQKKVVDALQEWVNTFPDRRKDGDGIVLYGPAGTGKDHLAFSAVGMVVDSTAASVKWINGRELVGIIRDRISEDANEGAFIRSLADPAILVISDPLPPIGDLTQHQADMLYRVCEARYANHKITVTTLNVADDDEADRRLGVATWDRLCHGSWKISCMWPGYRKPRKDLRP